MLLEGVYDPYICKAVFVVGGPGSGKNYIASKIFAGIGLKEVDSDYVFEYMLKTRGHTGKLDLSTMGDYSDIRANAKRINDNRYLTYINGRLGLVLTETGADYLKVKKSQNILASVGYDTYCLVVNTDLNIAMERNSKRNRTVPSDVVVSKWKAVQNNLGSFQQLFEDENFIIFDNTNPSNDSLKSLIKTMVRKIKQPIKNSIGRQWVDDQKLSKRR